MKHFLALSIAAFVLVAAGCGSSNSGSSTSSSSSGSSSSGAASSSSSSSSGGAAKSGNVAIDIKGFAFNPADITVKKGAKITWTNSDSVAHNVVASDGTFKSSTLDQGAKFSWTANKTGQWDYVCTFHANMKAHITVIS